MPSVSICTIASNFSRAQIAIRPGPAEQLEQRVLVPFVAGDGGDDLLGQDVERRFGNLDAVEHAAADRPDQRQAFQQLVARQREQPALGQCPDGVARAADALQERGDRPRRADLADQVDVADVDAHLQRRGGDDRLQLARLQPLLGIEANLARQAAVMAGDGLFAELLGQAKRDPLGQPPRVDEHQRAAVRLDQLRQPLIDFAPMLVRADGRQLLRRHFQAQVEIAGVADVDDRASAESRSRSRSDSDFGF